MSEDHIPPEQLFALVWAHRDKQGTTEDEELERMFRDLGEPYAKALAVENRLGPETAERLWEHAVGEGGCADCRMLILEDGPYARPPKTKAELAAEEQKTIEQRQKDVAKFWTNLVVGGTAFAGAFYCMQKIRQKKHAQGPEGGTIGQDPRDMVKQIDPLWAGFVIGILVASWFLAEAYTIARKLWIDFTAWKRAVPIVGKRWAEKGKGSAPGADD